MHWIDKFRNAFRGLYFGMQGQSSFHIHVPMAGLVLIAAWLLRCSPHEWCLLGLCIGLVMAAELANSAIEYLARGLCTEQNVDVGKALDIASAAVLVAAITSVIIGLAIFVPRALAWWSPS